MRIKQLDINDEQYDFKEHENLIFIKENSLFDSPFINTIKRVFCDTNMRLDCAIPENQTIKCLCEKYGADFTIYVKVVRDKLPKSESITGTCGSFEVLCKSDFENTTMCKRVLKRMFNLDFREMLLPMDTSREMAFYISDSLFSEFTDFITMYYWEYKSRSSSDKSNSYEVKRQEGTHESKLEREYLTFDTEWSAVEYFIDHFKKIDLGFCVIEFNKDSKELKIPEVEDDKELEQIRLCDYIIANKLNTFIEQSFRRDGATPLFIEDAFNRFEQKEIDFFINELRAMNRQVFIVESKNNPYLEGLCDRIINMEDKDD